MKNCLSLRHINQKFLFVMKKIFLTIALVAMTFSAKAQLFVGGEIGLSTVGGSTKTTYNGETMTAKNGGNTTISIAPELGYQFSEKFLVGASLGVNPTITKTYTGENTVTKTTTVGWSINPYARYRLAALGKFGVWAQGGLSIGGIKLDENTSTFAFNIGVLPVLSYSLNEHFTLLTRLNVFSLNFTTATQTTKFDGGNSKVNTNSFNIGASTNDVIGTLGGITFGCVYSF